MKIEKSDLYPQMTAFVKLLFLVMSFVFVSDKVSEKVIQTNLGGFLFVLPK